ncbi:alpha/beta-hydrolase [Hysterangium stoloniferum]|nr:alpha/beta-hydrolase [Hysterangium stoloniferum]
MSPSPFPTPAQHSLEALPLDSKVRMVYPIDYYPNPETVRLPLGKTTYWLLGPEDGPKVVLVHDLYGRGYSEAPEVVYNADLFITQLALLLQHVKFEHAHVVGLSMGGGIAAAFAAMFPNLVTEKLVFIASTGVLELTHRRPPVGPPTNLMETLRELQSGSLPGYNAALASSAVDGPIHNLREAFKMVSENSRLKCLIVHGTADKTVDIKYGHIINELLPAAVFVPIKGAGHDLTFATNHYEEVRTIILKFLVNSDSSAKF